MNPSSSSLIFRKTRSAGSSSRNFYTRSASLSHYLNHCLHQLTLARLFLQSYGLPPSHLISLHAHTSVASFTVCSSERLTTNSVPSTSRFSHPSYNLCFFSHYFLVLIPSYLHVILLVPHTLSCIPIVFQQMNKHLRLNDRKAG